MAVLLTLGFCPLVTSQPPPNASEPALFLVLEAGDHSIIERAQNVVSLLEAGLKG
jgi:hypothetical protein